MLQLDVVPSRVSEERGERIGAESKCLVRDKEGLPVGDGNRNFINFIIYPCSRFLLFRTERMLLQPNPLSPLTSHAAAGTNISSLFLLTHKRSQQI